MVTTSSWPPLGLWPLSRPLPLASQPRPNQGKQGERTEDMQPRPPVSNEISSCTNLPCLPTTRVRNQGPKTSSRSFLYHNAASYQPVLMPTRRRPACRHHILCREFDDVMPLHQVVIHLPGALVKASRSTRSLTREVERVHHQRRRSSLEPFLSPSLCVTRHVLIRKKEAR